MTTTQTQHYQRMDLYKQGLNDYEIAAELNLCESTIRYWRNTHRLKRNELPYTVRMEQALTPSQCEKMRKFLDCLTTYQDRFPENKIDVGLFIKEYREVMAREER